MHINAYIWKVENEATQNSVGSLWSKDLAEKSLLSSLASTEKLIADEEKAHADMLSAFADESDKAISAYLAARESSRHASALASLDKRRLDVISALNRLNKIEEDDPESDTPDFYGEEDIQEWTSPKQTVNDCKKT